MGDRSIPPAVPSIRIKKAEGRAAAFSDRLLCWYARHHRKLPWRRMSDPYAIWISEIMLQQTTVPTVIPYFARWLALFPDIQSLSKAPLQKVLKAWQGLGYYQRPKDLLKAAKTIVKGHNGRIPRDYQALRKLPGFGPYTAAAVMSLAFGQPYPVLDANVRRVLMRLGRVRGQAAPQKDKILRDHLLLLFPPRQPGLFNQAMMELGALVCRPRNPACLLCPVRRFCAAYSCGEQETIPAPKKKNSRKITAVIAVIRKGNKYLIRKRPSSGLLADLWEFPGGKKERGETLEAALRREVAEELGAEIKTAVPLLTVKHAYTQFRVTLHAFLCRLENAPRSKDGPLRWVTFKDLRRYPFPSGSARIVDYLETSRTPEKSGDG